MFANLIGLYVFLSKMLYKNYTIGLGVPVNGDRCAFVHDTGGNEAIYHFLLAGTNGLLQKK